MFPRSPLDSVVAVADTFDSLLGEASIASLQHVLPSTTQPTTVVVQFRRSESWSPPIWDRLCSALVYLNVEADTASYFSSCTCMESAIC